MVWNISQKKQKVYESSNAENVKMLVHCANVGGKSSDASAYLV